MSPGQASSFVMARVQVGEPLEQPDVSTEWPVGRELNWEGFVEG